MVLLAGILQDMYAIKKKPGIGTSRQVQKRFCMHHASCILVTSKKIKSSADHTTQGALAQQLLS
jgi:hypothetical protein